MFFPYCYFNGQVISSDGAFVSINDLGLLRGYAIFDFLRTYNGKPFLIDEHLDRFFQSARGMHLEVPKTKEEIKKIVVELLHKNEIVEAGIRFVLTGGSSTDGFTPGNPLFFITNEMLSPSDPEMFIKGVKLMSYEHLRTFPEVKTNNYITAIQLLQEKEKRNVYDILYTNNGNILECVRSNFFIVKKNKIITARNNILIGMTRNYVIRFAKEFFDIEERDIQLSELNEADEAFTTGTTRRIVPVIAVDDVLIGNGKVGPLTQRLMKIFDDIVSYY